MSLPSHFAQASLAASIVASSIGTYFILSPPSSSHGAQPAPANKSSTTKESGGGNDSNSGNSTAGDTIHSLYFTHAHFAKVALVPLGLMSLHTASLAYTYPRIPAYLLGHGAENGLDLRHITWSPATAIPLLLMLCVGIPLRLRAYTSLGKDFTFALTEPDRLKTSGLYRYVQHPSYTGLIITVVCNVALLFHIRGAFACMYPPWLFNILRAWRYVLGPIGFGVFSLGVWTRVAQEESMLRAKFGAEWERWHAKTARFVPWVF